MRALGGLLRKEVYHILRDRRTLAVIVLMPVVQVVLYGYAIPLLLMAAAIVGTGSWLVGHAEDLHRLRNENAAIDARTDLMLCEATNHERDIFADLIDDLLAGSTRSEKALIRARGRLQPTDCAELPSQRPRGG